MRNNPGGVAMPFLAAHGVKCHGQDKQLDAVRLDAPADGERMLAAREHVRAVIAWATVETGGRAAKLPGQGNLIPHELLFRKPAVAPEPPPARPWRLSPDASMSFVRDVSRKGIPGLVPPEVESRG